MFNSFGSDSDSYRDARLRDYNAILGMSRAELEAIREAWKVLEAVTEELGECRANQVTSHDPGSNRAGAGAERGQI